MFSDGTWKQFGVAGFSIKGCMKASGYNKVFMALPRVRIQLTNFVTVYFGIGSYFCANLICSPKVTLGP